jgi:hypothetical protein
LRKLVIFIIFICFTFCTIGEFVKICFEETELVKKMIDTEDSELEDSEKEVELDKVFYDNTPLYFHKIFKGFKKFFIFNNFQSYYSQVIYTILSPPPEN